jgi:hypothetical protein
MQRKKTFLVDSIKEYCFLDSKIIKLKGGEYEVPFATEPTKGNHSLETCENCRVAKENLIEEVNERFERFPKCCEYHRNLENLSAFNKEDFKDIANITANKVMYTYHHIINHLDSDNWYEDIVDYISYNFESFGSFPEGYGEPFFWHHYGESVLNLLTFIEDDLDANKISKVDIKTRMYKVKKLFNPKPDPETDDKRDFNLLMVTYERWYKIFPFELPYFNHLEEKFKKTTPLFTGRTHYNKYLKTTAIELHTKDSLTVVLLQITKNILTSINGVSLYEKGFIRDSEKHQIDLIVSNRKMQLCKLSAMPNANKLDYVKVLKKWFKEEKEFIEEIAPLLKNNPSSDVMGRPNRTDIAYCVFYQNETKTLETKNRFPSDKAWKELGKKYNKNAKNIQVVYNEISSEKDLRIQKSRVKNIEYVLNEILTDNIKAKKLAEDELNLAKLKS